ncbi:MAG: IS3 family transposase, partial [Candidatus Sedimenticola sp. (ex Thyasira tokunagai)]
MTLRRFGCVLCMPYIAPYRSQFRPYNHAYAYRGLIASAFSLPWRSAVESFFGSLKQERVHWRSYQTRYEAQQDILEYISMFYNSRRLHSYLDYMSPNGFKPQLLELKKAA